jgi:hypothetical protein
VTPAARSAPSPARPGPLECVPRHNWKHYFDWGAGVRHKIQALINARKVAGVHAGSALHLQDNAPMKGIYQ